MVEIHRQDAVAGSVPGDPIQIAVGVDVERRAGGYVGEGETVAVEIEDDGVDGAVVNNEVGRCESGYLRRCRAI